MTDHHPIDEPSQTPIDEGLRCPECEYNLTGLADEVCPECGEAFDRAILLARLQAAGGPIPEWSRRHEIGFVRAFVSTLFEMWLFPMRFGRRFPADPELKSPRLFARICLGVSFSVSWLAFAFGSRGGLASAFAFALSGIAVLVGVILCEYMMAGALSSPAEEALPGEEALPDEMVFDSGLALARMGRSYLVLSSAVLSSYVVSLHVFAIPWDADLTFSCVVVGMATYWWACMVLITAGRAGTRTQILNTLIVTPFIAIFCCMASCFMAFILSMLFFGFLP